MRKVVALKWVPPFAQGLVRDMRIRWALEEAGFDYAVELLAMPDIKTDAYREHQPFGQVPYYVENGVEMFESGAAVLHIAEQSEALLPTDPQARAHARQWLFAALNSVEADVQYYTTVELFNRGAAWAGEAKAAAGKRMIERLQILDRRLTGCDYLEDRFTAGDLMMTTVLRILRRTELPEPLPALTAYRERCEARPAFQRALAAHMAPFADNAPEPA
jgi:glutathione S-transferase